MTRRRGLAGHYAFYKTRVDAIEVQHDSNGAS